MKILVLGIGNDILADDAVGIIAANELALRLQGEADVIATSEHGVVLLDYFIGYDKALVIDAILTGKHDPGTVIEIDPANLRAAQAPSPHFTGIPDLFRLAKTMELDFPDEVRIIAIEVADPLTIGGEMTQSVRENIPLFIEKAESVVREWLDKK